MRKALGIVFLLHLIACAPASLEELRCEAEAEMSKLTRELEKIETREQLQTALPQLKKEFRRMAKILLEVRKIQSLTPVEPTLTAEKLFIELARLYELPGGRESLEQAQAESIRLLTR